MVYVAAYRAFKIAKRVYGYAKPTLAGDSFVGKFPPNYRNTVRTILTASERAFTGGLVSDILQDLSRTETTGGNGERKRTKSKTNKFSKKYRRRNVPYGRSRNRYKCRPCPKCK